MIIPFILNGKMTALNVPMKIAIKILPARTFGKIMPVTGRKNN